MRAISLTLVICFGSIVTPASHAQVESTPVHTGDVPETQQVWAGNLGDEPVGPGDLIFIAVTGSPDLSRSYRISADGTISLPLTHQSIQVAGMAPAAVANVVAKELTQEKVLVEPIVSVVVMDYRSRKVSVVGAVKAPVIIQAVGQLKLLDAIARAQGFSPDAGPEVIVTVPGVGSEKAQVTRIPIKELISGRNPDLDIQLHGGEEIRVPEARKLFVVGNVRLPGTYPLSDIEGTTVLKALALTQGTLPFTAREAYVYRLTDGSDVRQEIPVPLHDILHRKSPDFALKADDILYIPENGGAHLTATVLDRITGFGGQVGSGLLIFH
jgi:polysaccharide export outer membrane protein